MQITSRLISRKGLFHSPLALFFMALFCLGYSTSAADVKRPIGTFSGTLVFASPLQTNRHSFHVRSNARQWDLTLNRENSTPYEEVFSGEKQTIWVAHYPDIPPDGPLNTSMTEIFPGSRPLHPGPIEHIWAALFSRDTFSGKHPPLRDVAPYMSGPAIFTKFQITGNDTSPRYAQWHNEYADTHKQAIRSEGEFKWTQSTNLSDGTVIPVVSQLRVDHVAPNGERKTIITSELTLKEIKPLDSEPREVPTMQGRSVVYDFRVADFSKQETVIYDIQNGEIPATNSQTVILGHAINKAPPAKPTSKAGPVVVFGFITISVGFGLLIYNKQKTNPN